MTSLANIGAIESKPNATLSIHEFIARMPKAELHVHIEGTLEADMKFEFASRNGVHLPYQSAEDMRAAYIYHDLPSFLRVLYEGRFVLITEQDFYDLCYAYLKKVHSQNVIYAEIFFDPQQHTARGVAFETIIMGLHRASVDAEVEFGIESQFIMCFLRELSAESAMETLLSALPYKDWIVGVGLDSDEADNPPSKFVEVFAFARTEGFKLTMHCDVNIRGTHQHIGQALDLIGVDRVDHGVNALDEAELIARAKALAMTFTLCPYANEVVMPGQKQYPVRRMLDLGLQVTVNSDDPAYMRDHYLIENFELAQREAGLSKSDLLKLSENAFAAAWIPEGKRQVFLAELTAFATKQL